jgi:uncharacterized membrane protein
MHDQKDALARGLGAFSLALGAAQLAAPGRVARLIGVDADGRHATVLRVRGVAELATGAGILARRRPGTLFWSRVVGDVVDLALLAAAESRNRGRTTLAFGAVAGVLLPDLLESVRLTKQDELAANGPARVSKSVTVQRSPEELYEVWRDRELLPRFAREWGATVIDDQPGERIAWRSSDHARIGHSGTVSFKPAPGDRGTELTIESRYSAPGGQIGAAALKLLGRDPATQLADELRRFKQIVETGDVVRSDAVSGGHDLKEQLTQGPAQPLEATP